MRKFLLETVENIAEFILKSDLENLNKINYKKEIEKVSRLFYSYNEYKPQADLPRNPSSNEFVKFNLNRNSILQSVDQLVQK